MHNRLAKNGTSVRTLPAMWQCLWHTCTACMTYLLPRAACGGTEVWVRARHAQSGVLKILSASVSNANMPPLQGGTIESVCMCVPVCAILIIHFGTAGTSRLPPWLL